MSMTHALTYTAVTAPAIWFVITLFVLYSWGPFGA